MSNENLNAPEHCLQAMMICIRRAGYCYDSPEALNKTIQDAIHYSAGLSTGLQKLRDEHDKFKDSDHWLGELLAVLHSDGGHYLDDHGPEKATKDALAAYYRLIKALDQLEYERDRYRVALEQIARYWAQPARGIALEALAEADRDKPQTP